LSGHVAEFLRYALSQYAWPVLAVVVTFGIAILLHEFGHFVLARLSGVGVQIFSIGFGRPLWTIRRGDTEYRISVFPLGGYVKMRGILSKETERYLEGEEAGQEGDANKSAPTESGPAAQPAPSEGAPGETPVPSQSSTGLALAREAMEDTNALRGKLWPIRVLVFAAGCGFNFLIAVASFAVIGWVGTTVGAPFPSVVGSVKEGSALYEAGLRRDDRIIEFDGHAVATWAANFDHQPKGILDFVDDLYVAKETTRPIPSVVARRENGRETTHSLLLSSAEEFVNALREGEIEERKAPAYIAGVVPFSPAKKAGIKKGDIVSTINNRPIETFDQMREIVRASLGKPLVLRLKRGNEEIAVTVTPYEYLDPEEKPGTPKAGEIGVIPGNAEQEVLQFGFFRAWKYGFNKSVQLTKDVAVGTALVFKRFRLKELERNVAGPLGIFAITFESAREGWASFLFTMALLNVALMVFNILPIPILDGGHILITTIESVTRRPIPTKLLAGIYYVFFALIVSMLVMFTWFDVLRFDWSGLARLFGAR